MSEKLDALQEDLSEAEVESREWQELFECRGWQRLVEFATLQRNMRKETVILTPISSEHTAYMQEMMKGEVLGIGLVLAFPETQKEMADMKIRTLKLEMEMEDAGEEADARADVSRVDNPDTFG